MLSKEANMALARSRAISHHLTKNAAYMKQPELEKLIAEKEQCDKTYKRELNKNA